MNILAVSGSARQDSTNTALLNAVAQIAPPYVTVTVIHNLNDLPVFSPDNDATPPEHVRAFQAQVSAADALIIASPEYVRGIPGGLKNAIDWLVSGNEIIAKPMAIIHASHRGDDMLDALRMVLTTVSSGFDPTLFARFALMGKQPAQVAAYLQQPQQADQLRQFLSDLVILAKPRPNADVCVT